MLSFGNLAMCPHSINRSKEIDRLRLSFFERSSGVSHKHSKDHMHEVSHKHSGVNTHALSLNKGQLRDATRGGVPLYGVFRFPTSAKKMLEQNQGHHVKGLETRIFKNGTKKSGKIEFLFLPDWVKELGFFKVF